MDGYGIVIFLVGIVAFFVLYKRTPNLAVFFVWISGVGAGIFVGALWATIIVNRLVDNLFK